MNGKFRKGDWICSACKNHNYSFRETCNRCRKQVQPDLDMVVSTPQSIYPSSETELTQLPQFFEPRGRGFIPQYAQPYYMFSSLDLSQRRVGDEHHPTLKTSSEGNVIRDQSMLKDNVQSAMDSLLDIGTTSEDKQRKKREARLESIDLETSFYEKQILKSLLTE